MAIGSDIIQAFSDCLEAARGAGELEPTAMTLATRSREGGVSARTVLLKHYDERGFVFYTNLQSNKGRQLAEIPEAALVFHWKSIQRQVLVEGAVERVSDEEADAYFASRPRGSQLGAWASEQSRPLASRDVLLEAVAELESKHAGSTIPRPPHWTGFRLVPRMVEFWDGQDNRLHDRFRYTLDGATWNRQRLYP
jgi:pyridoxamine 5'-phosphate oxidase